MFVLSVVFCQVEVSAEKSYRLCRIAVCDLETSRMRRTWPTGGGLLHQKQKHKKAKKKLNGRLHNQPKSDIPINQATSNQAHDSVPNSYRLNLRTSY